MANKKPNDRRRKLLRSIATGGTVIVAGKSIPETWTKPIVNSVLLPTHASTSDDVGNLPTTTQSPPEEATCIGNSLTIGSGMVGIAIEYDGISSPTLVQVERSDYRSNDTIILVGRRDSAVVVGRGDWWSPHPRTIEYNVADGMYTRSSTRQAGEAIDNTYDVTFCITTSGSDGTHTLTVTLVSIVES